MSSIRLRKLLGPRKEARKLLDQLFASMDAPPTVEGPDGTVLIGEGNSDSEEGFAIVLDQEEIGRVKGGESAETIAGIISHLAQKEAEKKNVGQEVLGLYREINLIYNFSEKLSEAIEPAAIAEIALGEAHQLIPAEGGAVVLIDENTDEIIKLASFGDDTFVDKEIASETGSLRSLVFGGQSEIMNQDIQSNGSSGSLLDAVLHAALKVKHRIMGSILLVRNQDEQYKAADLKLLTTLALQSASAIESAQLYKRNMEEVLAREEAIRRIHDITTKFVPYEFIQSLGREVITDVKLGDLVERKVTVLFTDIRDFTELSEQMTPEDNFLFVSSFNRRMGPVIRDNGGFINQYLGDAIMAIFPNKAEDALNAAIQMQRKLLDYNAYRKKSGRVPIRMGIGMHTGPLIMGITGDQKRMDAATISDTVNTASRIESLNKKYATSIILSQETLDHIEDPGQFEIKHLDKVQVKGKKAPVSVYECADEQDS